MTRAIKRDGSSSRASVKPVKRTAQPQSSRRSGLIACIVATPSHDFADWVSAIERTAKDQGVRVMLDAGGVISDCDGAILITASPARAREVQAEHRVGLMADLTGAASAGAHSVGDTDLAAGGIYASATIAEVAGLPDTFRVTELNAQQETLTLWPGFSVTPPSPSPRGSGPDGGVAWAEAMQIYQTGVPPIGAKVRWDAPIFRYDARRADQRRVKWEMDVVGPARHLVFGPYFTLTAGLWRNTLRFAVDHHAADLQYQAQWGSRTEHVSETFTPGLPGVFEIALEFDFRETEPAELRVVQLQGSLGGAFEFLGARLERLR